jgi:hypothetical protein
VLLWFSGKPVYSEQAQAMHAVYPAASYVMLWLLLGWLPFTPARVIWAVTMGAAVGVACVSFRQGERCTNALAAHIRGADGVIDVCYSVHDRP